jgi:arylsulfatase
MAGLNEYRPDEPFSGVIGTTARESTPAWPVPRPAPDGAPNVLLIVLDDLGFAQLGCYGGLGGRIETPHIDRLAEEGIRFQNFHTTALCSPTRAALLTGRNHHSVGVATIMERATGYPGYNGRIPKDAAMLPAVLKEHGYNTMAVGKWHLTPDEESTAAGPYDRWPLGQGFERFYGFLPGETSQWEPDLWEDNHLVEAPGRPEDGYHLSADLVDRCVEWISLQKAVAPGKPFFTYLAFGAVHSPHHVGPEYIERYRGAFDAGWDVVREETLERQKELGIMPPETEVPPRNPGVDAWDDLTADQRRLFARQMEVFAGFLTHTDEQIGRLVKFLDNTGLRDDTLVMLLSDNGASAEGARNGRASALGYFNGVSDTVDAMLERLDDWGSPSTHPHYASGWGHGRKYPEPPLQGLRSRRRHPRPPDRLLAWPPRRNGWYPAPVPPCRGHHAYPAGSNRIGLAGAGRGASPAAPRRHELRLHLH